MEYITEVFKLEKKFPFAIFRGKGFSADAVKNGKTYMHNHYCLEINLALSSGGTYYIGDNTYPTISPPLSISSISSFLNFFIINLSFIRRPSLSLQEYPLRTKCIHHGYTSRTGSAIPFFRCCPIIELLIWS